jgi:pimeloyl-ACP methyl ester carboxylesterase
MTMAHAGTLGGGLPYRAAGSGPPLIVLPGISGDNADATGRDRRTQLRAFRKLTGRFTVYVINRRPGLTAGTTIRDLADDYAKVIAREFDVPVPVIGVSTGGSVAQLLAANHPVVSRLVLLASAHRLAEPGRRAQRALARYAGAGQSRRAWAATGAALAGGTAGRWAMTALLWLVGPRMTPPDPADLLTTIAAEDTFDAWSDLPRIDVPALVIGGARDGFYSPALFRETADRIPGARLMLYRAKGHVGTVSSPTTIREIQRFLTGTPGSAGT